MMIGPPMLKELIELKPDGNVKITIFFRNITENIDKLFNRLQCIFM